MDTVILARVEDFCTREGLLQPGVPQHLAAAVSGGADSMALLLLLRQLQPRFGYTLSACHVNHGLRGQSADRDEAFVRAECARLGVPLRVFHLSLIHIYGMAAAGCAGGAVGHRGNPVPLQAAQLGGALDKRHHLYSA